MAVIGLWGGVSRCGLPKKALTLVRLSRTLKTKAPEVLTTSGALFLGSSALLTLLHGAPGTIVVANCESGVSLGT